MMIKSWSIGMIFLFLLLCMEFEVELALKGIVWCGQLMVEIFNISSINICVHHGHEGKFMNILTCPYDDTM